MLFDISPIREEIGGRISKDEMVHLPWETEATRIELIQPWRVQADVVLTHAGFVLSGKATGEYTTTCDRCISPLTHALEADFSACFVQKHHGRSNHPENEIEEDDECISFEKDLINATPAIIEGIVLQMPMKQLCSPDCKGLCSQCGVNLNQKSCQCDKLPNDPRWSRLELLSGTKGGGQNGQSKE